jgi:hypothetical protein
MLYSKGRRYVYFNVSIHSFIVTSHKKHESSILHFMRWRKYSKKNFKELDNISRYVIIYLFIKFIYLFFAPALNAATNVKNWSD